MKSTLAMLALAVGSQALGTREAGCSFSISAYGGPGGPVGQLGDGQNRIGQTGLPTGHYNVDEQGGVWDDQGRGCILTPPTTQWQCDVGATPTPGFSVGCNGTISHDGESTFYACFTSDQGAWNIYSQPIPNEPTCTPIWMLADSCHDECVVTSTVTAPCTTSSTWGVGSPVSTWAGPPPVSAHAPPPVSTYAPPPAPKPACPAELPYNFEAPHLIIPVDAKHRDTKYGTSYNGTASGTVTSIFNFDMPSNLADKTCNLVFLLPEQYQLETSAYELEGEAVFSFDYLRGIATKETTFANVPPPEDHLGTVKLVPGSMTTISEREGCSAGKTVSFAMSAKGDSYINYFQDSNPCPLGLYVIPH